MSPKSDQATDASAPSKNTFMKDTMDAIHASTEALEVVTGQLRNALDDEKDTTILQADVLRAVSEHVSLVVSLSLALGSPRG